MSGTRYEFDDLAGAILDLSNERGNFASLLGARSFSRLFTLIVVLQQAFDDEVISTKLESLYSKIRQLTEDDSLFTLAWICAENHELEGLSPLEALFNEKLKNRPFEIVNNSLRGLTM